MTLSVMQSSSFGDLVLNLALSFHSLLSSLEFQEVQIIITDRVLSFI